MYKDLPARLFISSSVNGRVISLNKNRMQFKPLHTKMPFSFQESRSRFDESDKESMEIYEPNGRIASHCHDCQRWDMQGCVILRVENPDLEWIKSLVSKFHKNAGHF